MTNIAHSHNVEITVTEEFSWWLDILGQAVFVLAAPTILSFLCRKMSLLADNTKGLSIDEVLPLIGEFGRYQILLEILFCLLKASGSMTVLLPCFTQHNPGWQCTHNSTICSLDGVITPASKHYESRCNMPRSEWQFSQPKEYSVVTQVLICLQSFLIIEVFNYLNCVPG